MEILNIIESTKRDYQSGKLTLRDCAIRFYHAGWDNFIDIEETKKRLGL